MALDVESHYLRYGPMVLRRCRTLLRDPAKAEDAMQDVFVSLIRNEDRLRDEAPGALLLRIATNVCLNRLRGERRHPEDAHEDDDLALRIAQADDGGPPFRWLQSGADFAYSLPHLGHDLKLFQC